MATNTERLIVRLEASTRQFERRMERVEKKIGKTAKTIERDFGKANKGTVRSLDGIASALTKIGGAGLGLAAVGSALRGIASAGDQVNKLEGRFTALTDSVERSSDLMSPAWRICRWLRPICASTVIR